MSLSNASWLPSRLDPCPARAENIQADRDRRKSPGSQEMTGKLSPGLLAVLVSVGLSTALLVTMWPEVRGSLISPGDAMRLVEVRSILHGGSWFDLTEPRLGFAPGYLTHWSR